MTRRRELRFELLHMDSPAEPATPTNPSSRLQDLESDYEIIRELGRGGTAIVYQARDRQLARDVAIKVIRPTYLDDTEAVARLAREAKVVALLRHPNIVPIFGTRHLRDGSLALIMQYVPGRTVKRAIREDGPLPIAVAVNILREIALALDYAHSRHSVVHRDIKPENIYLDDELGRALLSDFGIARTGDSDSSLTLAGTALGTPAYMSPEQIDGLDLDGRSDLYSLGLVAWEMLSGEQPWAGQNMYTIIYKQKHEDLPSLETFRPDVPAYLQRAIDGLLRKDREQRWTDAAQFLSRLQLSDTLTRIAPPAVTIRAAREVETDDSLTVVYRREDAEQAAREFAAGEARAGSASAARVETTSLPAAHARVATAAAPGSRRKRVLVGLFLFLVFMATDNAPLLTGAADGRAPAGVAPEAARQPPPGMDQPRAVATGEQGPPARLLVLLAQGQTGGVGEPLTSPVAVLVEDSLGRPVKGAAVTFTVAAGRGRVQPGTAVSDTFGLATVAWTLGVDAGRNELAASIEGTAGVSAVLRATGVAGPATRLAVASGNDQAAQRGSRLPEMVAVRAEDAHGNPVAGALIEFEVISGGGTAAPLFAPTDSSGLAQVSWTLGSELEANTLRATLPQSGLQAVLSARARYLLASQTQVVAGGTHTCVLSAQGELSCWGGNDSGQLGAGTAGRQSAAARVSAPLPFARVAAGIAHTCALDRDGAAHCWGVNDNGQLGTGDRSGHATPTSVRGVAAFIALTAGLSHTCALAADGRAFCWGAGSNGQVGDGTGNDRTAPVSVAGGHAFTMLSSGWRHTCGLTAQGIVYCWGTNRDGQLGDGTTADRSAPVRVTGSYRFTAIGTGAAHSCGLTAEGEAYCWGQNDNGQLGDSSTNDSARPVLVQASVAFASVAAGAVHTCAVTRTGEAYCWGRNNFGQLGNDNAGNAQAPVPVAGGHRFSYLTASGSHTCGRAETGGYFCWGYNVDGQLGDGTRSDRAAPVRVSITAR